MGIDCVLALHYSFKFIHSKIKSSHRKLVAIDSLPLTIIIKLQNITPWACIKKQVSNLLPSYLD